MDVGGWMGLHEIEGIHGWEIYSWDDRGWSRL